MIITILKFNIKRFYYLNRFEIAALNEKEEDNNGLNLDLKLLELINFY